MDIRLDFINKFEDGAHEKMAEMRNRFIKLDDELKELSSTDHPALNRCVALARTNLEQASQYAIKSICLKYEAKGKDE